MIKPAWGQVLSSTTRRRRLRECHNLTCLTMSNSEYAIAVHDLTYSHGTNGIPSLSDISLHLPPGSRTILVGANGGVCASPHFFRITGLIFSIAGKSTLLQILAGKRLIKGADVRIRDRDVFRDSPPGVTFLGTEWRVASQSLPVTS